MLLDNVINFRLSFGQRVDAVRAGIEAFAETIETSAVYPIPDDQIIHNVAVLQAIIRSAATRMPEVVG